MDTMGTRTEMLVVLLDLTNIQLAHERSAVHHLLRELYGLSNPYNYYWQITDSES